MIVLKATELHSKNSKDGKFCCFAIIKKRERGEGKLEDTVVKSKDIF
jgi:hypothetical protein